MTDVPTRADMSDDLDAFRHPPLPTGLASVTAPACDDLVRDQDQVAADSRWLAKHRRSRQKNLQMPDPLVPHKNGCYPDGPEGGPLICMGAPNCPANRDTH